MADMRRVLVVDDSATVCGVVDKILRNCGFVEIETLQHGRAALDRLQAAAFDLVICDLEMAPMSGIDLLREVRRKGSAKKTHFILMSAMRDMDWILAAKKAGADCLISKPFTAAMLMQKISQMGARH